MNDKKIKVSIIMGIYNCEKTLSDCIDSLLNQTYTNWELIMCDDSSTDCTYKIAKRYVEKYNNIVLLRNKTNKKLSATLNKCLEVAKGEYVARMDADDISLPTRLEKQVEFLDNNKEYSVVGCNRIIFDDNGNERVYVSEEMPNKYSLLNGVPFAHPTIMMRKNVYDKLNGYTVSSRTVRGQDLDLWYRFYKNNFKGYNIQEPLYRYRENLNDYKKRTLKAATGAARTNYYGFKMLNFPRRKYIYLVKPIISACIPNYIMYKYHNRK